MSIDSISNCLERGLENGCADDIEEGLCNLDDGACDAVELIPLLERVASANHFCYFDDNSAGGLPHATGKPVPFGGTARSAIQNIRENAMLGSNSPIARLLKSASTHDVEAALAKLVGGNWTDEGLFPILEKIARKDAYHASSYIGGRVTTHRFGQAARNAILRIRENRIAAGLPMKICSICETIPHVAVANTGREEYFGKPITSLKRLELDQDDDLWECPECGALFHWNDNRSQTGSGNNDEETLSRLAPKVATVVRTILHGTRPPADPGGIVEGLISLDSVAARTLSAKYMLKHDRALARQLVPAFIRAAADGRTWASEFLKDFAADTNDARLLLRELEDNASPLTNLRKYLRSVTCPICASVKTYPPLKMRRTALPPNFARLKPLGASERNDLWVCPECDSLHHWKSEDGTDGGLGRVTSVLADALRNCIYPDGAARDDLAIKTLFACGREWQELLFAYGMQHDHQLVVSLVPHMVKSLSSFSEDWLYRALCEVARDPLGASAVRLALADKIDRPNNLIQLLVAQVNAGDRPETPGKSA